MNTDAPSSGSSPRIFDQLGYPAGAAARQDGGRYSQAGGAHLEDLVRYLATFVRERHGPTRMYTSLWAG